MNAPKIFIVAGEASGDIIGGRLIAALNRLHPGITYSGIGGLTMTQHGFNSLFPIHELSVMGIFEIIPRYLQLRKRFFQTVQAAINFQPDVIITIDFPGFNIRLVKELRKHLPNTKFVQYVGPSVWAHKPERAKVVADLFDHVLLLLPFEKPYFETVGVPNTVVGHPILEHDLRLPNPQFMRKYGLQGNATPILVMPGSREAEIRRLMPIFADALKMLPGDNIYLVPTMTHLKDDIMKYASNLPITLITDDEEKWQAMSACKVGLIKSGTATVEVMAYKLPMVIAYDGSWLSKLYVRLHVKVKYASLANLLLDHPAIPELLFHDCTPRNICDTLIKLLISPSEQATQQAAVEEALRLMHQGIETTSTEPPSMVAARIVVGLL